MSHLDRRTLIGHTAPAAVLAGLAGGVAAAAGTASAAATSGALVLVEPFRLQDSRVNEPDKYDTGAVDGLAVPGLAAHQGVLLNVTVTQTEGSGFVWVGKAPVAFPTTSNINWSTNDQTLANFAIVFTGPGQGGITVQLHGNGRTHLIIDVVGFVAS
jgi:hypothetical protein